MKKNITILGSTGSIGKQTLEIIGANPDLFNVIALTTHSNIALLERQCKTFNPELVVITNKNSYLKFLSETNYNGDVLYGNEGLQLMSAHPIVDIVVSSLVGIAGLLPTITAINHGKTILLANKEVLVVAGEYVMNLTKQNGTKIFPIDSEHSAIYQCLMGENTNDINKMILTASGGPFFKYKKKELENVKVSDALKHPTWTMGTKITIDSATMMNKGF